MTVPIARGDAPRRYTDSDEHTIAIEAARLDAQRRRTQVRFLVRKHTSVWSRLFPDRPAWVVWDRETGQLTEWPTWGHAMRHLRYLQRGWAYCKRTGGYELEGDVKKLDAALTGVLFLEASA